MSKEPAGILQVVRWRAATWLDQLTDQFRIMFDFMPRLRNAIDAVHGLENERRRVTIATRLDAQGDAELCVVDLGEGVPEEARKRLFDAFVTTKPGGLGLGLAICRSVIEAHGGRVRHEPNTPRGTRFSFALPRVSV